MSLADVVRRAADAARRAGRPPEDVAVVAVSKGRSIEEIRALYDLGQRDFGENRAQELRDKVGLLPADVRWHFVGYLQTNKVRHVRPVAALLHSMDRPELGAAWMKGPGRPPPALLQVNIGEEPQKHGVAPDEVVDVAEELCRIGVPLRGVMAIAPIVSRSAEARPYFRRLREIRDELSSRHPQIEELSMGMTDDFEVAVEEGATLIRVGRAIFGD